MKNDRINDINRDIVPKIVIRIVIMKSIILHVFCGIFISSYAFANSEVIGEKATKIYQSFFKSIVGKEIPTEEANCLIELINSLDKKLFQQAVKPLSHMTFEEFSSSVAEINFYPNGKLSSDFSETQPVAQMVEMMSKNSCK